MAMRKMAMAGMRMIGRDSDSDKRLPSLSADAGADEGEVEGATEGVEEGVVVGGTYSCWQLVTGAKPTRRCCVS
jgi:hypothetical protein